MESNSRRAFLTGRRRAQTPWDAFCQRVQRTVSGNFFEFESQAGQANGAQLVPKQAADVHHVRALCAEYGVTLALDGIPFAARIMDKPVLWINPGDAMGGCQRLAPDSSKWFVQPGCLLGDLVEAGFTQFADLPYHITVAAWLADRSLCDWAPGQTSLSGVEHVSLLLADGSSTSLGPFGEHNQKPLSGVRMQQLVPALFQLANSADAQACMAAPRWPGKFRLDALLPNNGQSPNLAHLLLGHGGELGWVEWLVIDQDVAQPHDERPYYQRYSAARTRKDDLEPQAERLDQAIKTLFDDTVLFPDQGQDM
ncbi:MAG: hypothetical protein KA735_14115 [Burkholderiaceae bacterium]|nr:hypothetical protein [Burkholderiaceae bacterium]